ncbi:MAG TPA: class I SAM-dependent methyltransferase [Chitinophagaceae bacterium]|nr:class I SAM-dependent methyltransferase [Chitinophagaceae bacterium]
MMHNTSLLFILLTIATLGCHAQNAPYRVGTPSADGTGKFYMGREIAQVMGAGGGSWLERDERQEEENTQLAIEKMRLRPNFQVADIGAGTGYYSFRMAAKLPQGKVWAVEIQDEFIRYLQERKATLQDAVVNVVKGTLTSPNLPENSLDLAIMVDVYHELTYPQEVLQAIRKSLKPGGRLLLIEYRGEDPAIAIKPIHKTTVLQLNRELEANGFRLALRDESLPIQHFLMYEKKQ